MINGQYTMVPPDGGWGWMVVMGSWLVNVLTFGLFRAGGIVLMQCVAQFHTKHSVAAWIPVISTGLAFFLAPVSGILVRRYTYRQVVFIGGLACTIGLSICHFANEIQHVFIGYGVLLGIGFGLSLNPNLTIVGLYFQKRRALATGISFSGGAVGVFVMGPLLELLFEHYGFRGAFLILSGIFLHICVAATLFHPVEYHMIPAPIIRNETAIHLKVTPPPPPPPTAQEWKIDDEEEEESNNAEKDELQPNGNLSASLINGHRVPESKLRVPLACLDEEFLDIPKLTLTTVDGNARSISLSLTSVFTNRSITEVALPPQWRRDLELITNEALLLVSLAYGIALAAYVGTTVMLPDYVRHEVDGRSGVMDGYMCVITAAVGDLIGRLIVGWFIDRLGKKKRQLYHVCLSLMGISVSILPFLETYLLLLLDCWVLGLMYGVCLVHSPCFLAEFFGVPKLPWTMGLMLTLAGIPVICLGPVIGIIKEDSGSYKASFWCLGAMVLAICLFWFLLPYFLRRLQKNNSEMNTGNVRTSRV